MEELLIALHKERSKERKEKRQELQERYEKVEQDIQSQIESLPDAKRMGFMAETEKVLLNLKAQRNKLQAELAQTHDEGSEWIDKTLKCFELLKVAQEMLNHGSPRVREQVLKALASNYTVLDKTLTPALRSPFLEAVSKDSELWWAISDSNRGPFECESNALTS